MRIKIIKNFKGDVGILVIFGCFCALSILLVYSATGPLAYKIKDGDTLYFLIKQFRFVILAIIVVFLCYRLNYKYYYKFSLPVLVLSCILLIITYIFGTQYNAASRWLSIPFIDANFQTSVLAKFSLLIYLAGILAKKRKTIEESHRISLMLIIICGGVCGLIALADISGAILLSASCVLMLLIGSKYLLRTLLHLIIIAFLTISLVMIFGQRYETMKSRLKSYLNKEIPLEIESSYIAIASGGILGKGPGNSIQKDFITNAYSDFIFAILVEEYGIIFGVLAVLFLYLFLLYRSYIIAGRSKDSFGNLLVLGLALNIIVQAFTHVLVVLGIFPVTGLTLPMLSMGGTSIILNSMGFGIILSVSKENNKKQ